MWQGTTDDVQPLLSHKAVRVRGWCGSAESDGSMANIYSIKDSKSSFANLKLIAFVVLLAGLASVVVFKSTDPSRFTDASIQNFGNPNVRVWVNTNTGVYHCPNSRWYGKSKSGNYMAQKEAQAKGYRPAYGIVCG